MFYQRFEAELRPHSPVMKFMVIKGVVFFTFWYAVNTLFLFFARFILIFFSIWLLCKQAKRGDCNSWMDRCNSKHCSSFQNYDSILLKRMYYFSISSPSSLLHSYSLSSSKYFFVGYINLYRNVYCCYRTLLRLPISLLQFYLFIYFYYLFYCGYILWFLKPTNNTKQPHHVGATSSRHL
jgi:Organic solute transporter Ostalpha